MAGRGSAPVDHDRVWRLHLQGLSSSVIAERLGCSRKTVTKVVAVRRAAEAPTS